MKYFTKYLPFEGGFQRVVKNSQGFPTDFEQEVKLFLCSKDIQIGDLVFVPDQEEAGNIVDNEDLVYWKQKNSYKMIGEVSSEAFWITEGMEFEKSEVSFRLEEGFKNYALFRCPTCKTFH